MCLDPGSEYQKKMEDQTMNINIDELKRSWFALTGKCSGVYFLFNNDDLVYVGESWNCFLGVAENTKKDNFKEFTNWNFIHIEDDTQRRDLKKQIISKYQTKYN